jgi:DNA-binding NarL/FixJ family response regulator
VTLKTVEWHVKNVFVKLEVSSRREVARVFAEQAPEPDRAGEVGA